MQRKSQLKSFCEPKIDRKMFPHLSCTSESVVKRKNKMNKMNMATSLPHSWLELGLKLFADVLKSLLNKKNQSQTQPNILMLPSLYIFVWCTNISLIPYKLHDKYLMWIGLGPPSILVLKGPYLLWWCPKIFL